MMRLWRAALLRELLRGAAGGHGTGPGTGHGSGPGQGSRRLPPPPLSARRRVPAARGLCTRSEGALEEPGKAAQPQQQPPGPGEPPLTDGGRSKNHGGAAELAAGGER